MRRELLIVLGMALLLPAGAMGQRGPRRASPRMGMRHTGPQMGMWHGGAEGLGAAFNPQMLLRRRSALDLSDEQVTQLEALTDAVQSAMDQAREATREHGDALRDAWRADEVDPEAITTHARALLDARQDVALAGIDASARAMSVLSPEQRGRVRGWHDGARGMRGRGRLDDRRGRTRMPRFRRFE